MLGDQGLKTTELEEFTSERDRDREMRDGDERDRKRKRERTLKEVEALIFVFEKFVTLLMLEKNSAPYSEIHACQIIEGEFS